MTSGTAGMCTGAACYTCAQHFRSISRLASAKHLSIAYLFFVAKSALDVARDLTQLSRLC